VNAQALGRTLFFGPLRQGRGRLALALAAIALGVALGYAVQLVNQSAIGEFEHAVQTLAGSADLELRGPRAGFDESLYPRLARLPEVAVASPVIEADVRLGARRRCLAAWTFSGRGSYSPPRQDGRGSLDTLIGRGLPQPPQRSGWA
jgi:putative ABC transport system permease protein